MSDLAELGVNVDARGAASPAEVAASGARWVRFVLLPDVTPTRVIFPLRRAGLDVLAVLARESLEGFASYEAAAEHYASWCGECLGVQIGNEPDLNSPSSWRMAPADYSELVRRVAPVWRRHNPGSFVVGAGLASGQPSYLQAVDVAALALLDAIALHPYGKSALGVRDAVNDTGDLAQLIGAYGRFGKPIWVTEYGTNDRDEARAARYVGALTRALKQEPRVAVALHFCWSDSMVEPFGLLGRDGRRKAAYEAFMAVVREGGTSMATTEERLKQLEKQQSLQTDAIAAILADHYQDGPQSAKGLLVQLNDAKFKDLAVVEKAPKA